MELTPDKRASISLPVHCINCKKPTYVEWRVGAKVSICENDKCMRERTYKRVLIDNRSVEIINWIMFV